MGRPRRTQIGGLVYHVLNRAKARAPLCADPGDYAAFLRTLADAQAEHPRRLLFSGLLPNPWHRVPWPEHDRSLSPFVAWLTLPHTQRWHAYRGTAGSGHLYQGRFKSFAIEADAHLLTVGRYVERHGLRTGLVACADDWRWGSLAQRLRAHGEEEPIRAAGPVPLPADWTAWVDAPLTATEEDALRRCARRGQPFGSAPWMAQAVRSFGLQSTQRRPGRPRNARPADQRLLFDENGS